MLSFLKSFSWCCGNHSRQIVPTSESFVCGDFLQWHPRYDETSRLCYKIFRIIISHLEIEDLKNCCLASKSWQQQIYPILKIKQLHLVDLRCRLVYMTFFNQEQIDISKFDLECRSLTLEELIIKVKKFENIAYQSHPHKRFSLATLLSTYQESLLTVSFEEEYDLIKQMYQKNIIKPLINQSKFFDRSIEKESELIKSNCIDVINVVKRKAEMMFSLEIISYIVKQMKIENIELDNVKNKI